MRIHSRILTRNDLYDAARKAGVQLIKADRKGSRSHGTAWDVALSGTGKHGGMYGNLDYPTATWDEWGAFLTELYTIDDQAMCGNAKRPTYGNAEHFHWATTNRYRDGLPADAHYQHKWEWSGTTIGGTFSTHRCRKCGAYGRTLYSMSWWNFSGDRIADYRTDVLTDASV
jgi:hypothetical protein